MRRSVVMGLLGLVALGAGCGQKGDLYLPSPEREPVATLPAGAVAPAADEDDAQAQPPAAGNATGAPTTGAPAAGNPGTNPDVR